ncbi:MAG: winged helix-turn-helix transcriptional regulator, partial [Epsilonproteobacteria bacterium]|nr:winged helix-turn-helix transcriptional regulator [Campylobacterota bacterium]
TTQETTQDIKKLSTREKIIIELKKDGTLTREDLAKLTGVSSNAIKQHLSKLKSENKIKRVGSTKSGFWEVLDA